MSSSASSSTAQPEPSAKNSQAQNSRAKQPQRLIFSQHGWSDTGHHLGMLVRSIAPQESEVIAPSLDFWQTWLRIEPLIRQKEAIVTAHLRDYPDLPLRVVAHSMGGLIWTELLHRHPEWWSRLESFVMVGSPIGGSDIARMIDPFGLGIGIARDLGVNRRSLAEAIAAQIPTLVIASDVGGGTDGIVTVECTKVSGAGFVLLPNIYHANQRIHSQVGKQIQAFWANPSSGNAAVEPSPAQPKSGGSTTFVSTAQPPSMSSGPHSPTIERAIAQLRSVPGMTDAAYRDLPRATIRFQLDSSTTLRTWRNPAGLSHVFLANDQGQCLYAGYVGWFHNKSLRQTIRQIQTSR